MDYFTQQKQYLKRTTLRRLKIPLQSIRSKEGLHYRLGVKRQQESCHLTSNNQLLFTSWISFGDSTLGLYCAAGLTQESVSSRIFCEKERYESCTVQTDVHSRRFPQKAEKGKVSGSDATTRFPWASCFWETHAFCTRNMGAHVWCTCAKKLVSSDFTKILKVATKTRETCEKTWFTPFSPVKATKLYCFCLSDKRSPKLPINVKR